MTTFPLNLITEYGTSMAYAIYALLGIAFGFILESAGFGNSKKLAAQFYFKELTVFKVMFTAIIVAMVLIFFATALGLLDYQLLWVNPTYIWPGILGGLIMGAGFILGGFCPGTSLVAAATLKIDGLFFVLGALFGIFVFGETVDSYNVFFNSSYLGRINLAEFFNLSYGAVVVIIVAMALVLFVGAEWVEKVLSTDTFPSPPKWRIGAAAGLAVLAVITFIIGQPTLSDRWQWIAQEQQPRIDNRQIYASPLEIATLQNNRKIRVKILDLRSESAFNYFHIRDAQLTHFPSAQQATNDKTVEALAKTLISQPANTVFVLAGHGEEQATGIWKLLKAASVPNVYVLEGGVNGWIQQFATQDFLDNNTRLFSNAESATFAFDQALGQRYPMASPNLDAFKTLVESEAFVRKVTLEVKRAPEGGGCG